MKRNDSGFNLVAPLLDVPGCHFLSILPSLAPAFLCYHKRGVAAIFPHQTHFVPAASASLLDRLPKRLSDRAEDPPACLPSLSLSAWLSSDADMM